MIGQLFRLLSMYFLQDVQGRLSERRRDIALQDSFPSMSCIMILSLKMSVNVVRQRPKLILYVDSFSI